VFCRAGARRQTLEPSRVRARSQAAGRVDVTREAKPSRDDVGVLADQINRAKSSPSPTTNRRGRRAGPLSND